MRLIGREAIAKLRTFSILLPALFLLNNVLQAATNVAGNAVVLHGTNYIRTTLWSPEIFKSENFAFELWFKAIAPGVLVGEADTADVTIWDHSFLEILSDGRIRGGVPGLPAISVGQVPFGTWHHVALNYDHAQKILTSYLDGIQTGSSVGERTHPSERGRTTVYTFGRGGPTNLGEGNWYSGELDEIRIWDQSVPAENISMFFNRVIETNHPGLSAYWQFSSANGNLLPDSSPKGNPALHVPETRSPTLVSSTVPVEIYPTIRTLSAISETNVTRLTGVAQPRGSDVEVFFEWGVTAGLGNNTATQAISGAMLDQNFSATLTNLPIGSYFFRAVGLLTNKTIVGAVQPFSVFGPAGRAIALRGDDYFRSTLWSHQMFTDENFTFELWFNPKSPGVLINEADTADVARWDISFAEVLSNGVLRAGAPGLPTLSVTNIHFNQWHHLALTYSQVDQTLSLYLNGQLAGAATGNRLHPSESGRTAVYAFGRGGPTNLAGGQWFQGQIDDVRIWSTALGAETIAASFDKIIDANQPNLQANWRFTTVENDLIPDESTRQNPALYVAASPPSLLASTAPLTLDQRPAITAQSARNVNPFLLELSGSVNAREALTWTSFQYWTLSETNQTPPQNIGQAAVPISFRAYVPGLVPGSIVNYRVVASNASGIALGHPTQITKSSSSGNGLRLSGNNQSLRTFTAVDAFFTNETITVELWFYATKAGVLVSEFDPGQPRLDYSILELLPSGSLEAGFTGLTPFSLGRVELRQWHHVALRYNKAALRLDAFLDGQKTTSSTGDRTTLSEAGARTFMAFGKSSFVKLGTGEFFGGELDEIRVWNVARTDQQIQSSYARFVANNEAGLVFYWQLDETAGPVIADSSSREITGRATGTFVPSAAPVAEPAAVAFGPTGTLTVRSFTWPELPTRLDMSTNLVTWTPFATNQSSLSGRIEFPVLNSEHKNQFFRFVPH